MTQMPKQPKHGFRKPQNAVLFDNITYTPIRVAASIHVHRDKFADDWKRGRERILKVSPWYLRQLRRHYKNYAFGNVALDVVFDEHSFVAEKWHYGIVFGAYIVKHEAHREQLEKLASSSDTLRTHVMPAARSVSVTNFVDL